MARDPVNAEAAFRKALVDAPQPWITPVTVQLASALTLAGRWAEASAFFESVMQSLQGLTLAYAQTNYAMCQGRLGNLPAAFQLWEIVIASGYRQPADHAQVWLGEEKLRLGDIAGALPHLAVAVASASAEVTACAKANLGHIQALNNNVPVAERLWNDARNSGYISASSQADVFIAVQLIKEGEFLRAKQLLESVVLIGHPESAADAKRNLVLMEGDES